MNPDNKNEGAPLESPDTASSLETPDTVVENGTKSAATDTIKPQENGGELSGESLESDDTVDTSKTPDSGAPDGKKPADPKKTSGIRAFLARFNVYLLLFILLLLIAAIAMTVAAFQAHKASNNTAAKIGNQPLSQSALQDLANSDATVGTSSQTLNVQSNAIFAGQVIARSNLEVAGTIKVGGGLSIPSISVSGSGTFGSLQSGSVAISGNAAIQGNLTTQGNLNVNGTGSFGTLSAQRLSVGSLQLNSPLVLTSHITAGGPVPRKSDGNALGSGGTSSLSGSDTAGTITINTGGGPAAGCFVNVTFAQAFSGSPRVLLTPASSAAAGLPYYVNRTGTSFSVCTAAPAAAGQNITFDYAIFD